MPRVNIAVLASGQGSNLQALLEWSQHDDASGRIALVISNRTDAGALVRARAAGVQLAVLYPGANEGAVLLEVLHSHGIDLVVLAGYLRKIPPDVIEDYRGRIINIHPALLPSFGGPGMYGHHVHEAVLASGVRVTGATVHIVDEHYDRGPIVAQWPVPVRPGDTPDSLAARVLEVEHRLLPAAVQAFCARIESDLPLPAAMHVAADAFVLSYFPEQDLDAALVAE